MSSELLDHYHTSRKPFQSMAQFCSPNDSRKQPIKKEQHETRNQTQHLLKPAICKQSIDPLLDSHIGNRLASLLRQKGDRRYMGLNDMQPGISSSTLPSAFCSNENLQEVKIAEVKWLILHIEVGNIIKY
ncbi:hypothetical protein RRG08_046890 [Elysia crispata]|uniref:Uncharacterized protein n=1 Tax=Elysia crispata TaxID=231223 RepID=A0AAE1DHA4_9GAST|nr:hypothetical protein RRG08_046890 [Elysia crispata]